MPKIVGTALLLSLLLLSILQLLIVEIVNAEMIRHSRDVERFLTDRIVCVDIISRWLEDIGLVNTSKELKVLAKELKTKALSNISSMLLFELYTNASMALTIGGIELRALKRLAGYRDDITLRDVIQLIDVVRRELLQDSTPIPSCSSTLSKIITDITYGIHGRRCNYNSSDMLTLAFLSVLSLSKRAVDRDEMERSFESVFTNLLMGNVSRESLYDTLKLLMVYRSLVLGISLYRVLSVIQRVPPQHSQNVGVDIERGDFVGNVLEIIRFFQELRSINVSVSSRDMLLAFSLMESIDKMFNNFSNVGALAKIGRKLVELYLKCGNVSAVSSSALSTLESLENLELEIEKALIMLRRHGRSLSIVVEESYYAMYNTPTGYVKKVKEVPHQSVNENYLMVLSYPIHEYSYSSELGLDLNLVDVVADPQILDLLDEVNSIDLADYTKVCRDREAKLLSVNPVEKEHKLTLISAYAVTLIVIAIVLGTALSMLKVVSLRARSLHMFGTTAFATTKSLRQRDPLITEFWRMITEIAMKYNIAIPLSDTHREAVKKIMRVFDENDRYELSWVSKLYELVRFSRREVAKSDREQALWLLRYFSQKYRGKDGLR